MANEYEQLRLKNLEDNRKILAEIGLINPYKTLPKVSFKKGIRGNKRKADDSTPNRPVKKQVVLDPENSGSLRGSRRRSARIQGKDVPSGSELKEEIDEWIDENEAPTKVPPNRPNFYGAVPGVEIGTIWTTRVECCRDGIHRPTVAGIHAGQDGAYSIALSGGYEDNVDLGECFTYTGEGGRDLKGTASNPKNLRTAPQSKDQELSRGNLALSRNVETGNPVRVIRGYKLQQFSPFAPEDGYRYDGLYTVEKFWQTTGQSGFKVWKFALRRCTDQPPPPWTFAETDGQSEAPEEMKSDSGFDSDETASQISSSQSSDQISSSQSSTGSDETGNQISSSQPSDQSDEKENHVKPTQKEEKTTEANHEQDKEKCDKNEIDVEIKDKIASKEENIDKKISDEPVTEPKVNEIGEEKEANIEGTEPKVVDSVNGKETKNKKEEENVTSDAA